MEPTSTYRADIDGLRAVAVVFVVLYHFGVWPITGGFVGVDVFFVISGYLITSIIRREMAAGSFSFWRFYERRFRRILPALLLVVGASLATGWFFLMPGDYIDLGTQSLYASFGLSNFYFFWNTNYFDQAADMLPLLHTWSLAVEEQFYVFWPLVLGGLIWAQSFHRAAVPIGILAIIIISFVVAVATVSVDPSEAFYMLHTRAWELALGGLMTLMPTIKARWQNELLNASGLALIIGSAVYMTSAMPFPGWTALPAVTGAAMIVWPKEQIGSVQSVLGARPAVFLGLISYSLYLWHWPVLVFYRFYNHGAMPPAFEAAGLIGICIFLSYLSWRYVEKPFRKGLSGPRLVIPAGLAASFAVAFVGFAIAKAEGVSQRVSPDLMAMRSLDVMWEWSCRPANHPLLNNRGCYFGAEWDAAEKHVLVWGDSHAAHIAPVLEAAGRNSDTAYLLYEACPAMLGGTVHRYRPTVPTYHEYCVSTRRMALDFLSNSPEVDEVVLSAAWTTKLPELYADEPGLGTIERGQGLMSIALKETMDAGAADGRRFVLVGQIPNWDGRDPVQCAAAQYRGVVRRQCDQEVALEAGTFRQEHQPTHLAIADAAHGREDVSTVIPGDGMCNDVSCVTTLNGEFLYRDSSHIRRNLSEGTLSELAALIGLD